MRHHFILLAASAALVFAQDDTTRRVDDLFQSLIKPGAPGASVAVIREGKVVLQKGYGMANLEYDVPIRPETVFHVASVSKQFTAMAIVLLELDGKLSLEDDVHKYLPELPDYGRPITIRNLLQHTSGIRDQWQTLSIGGWRMDDVITQEQLLHVLFRQKELNFEPGTKHLYSNGGYTLLAEIVARVSGKPLPDFAAERIFRPLGMSRTHFHIDHQQIVRDRAYSYEPFKAGLQAAPLNYANVGATSLFTTAPDLAKWLDNFREPKVGGARAIARLQEQAVLSGGEKIPYALGVGIEEYRGLKTVSHNGGDAGYRSHVVWFPEQQLGIAVLSNLASFNPTTAANRVADIFLEKQMTKAPPRPQPSARTFITLPPDVIRRFEGHYRLDELLLRVESKDGKLMAAPMGEDLIELKPMSATRFYFEAEELELEFVAGQQNSMKLKLTQRGQTGEAERVVLTLPDPKDLGSYAGSYWSEEVETQYTIRLKNGKLIADHIRHGEVELVAVAKDSFRSPSWFMAEVRFVRDGAGKVVAMTLGGGRVNAIRFMRR